MSKVIWHSVAYPKGYVSNTGHEIRRVKPDEVELTLPSGSVTRHGDVKLAMKYVNAINSVN